MPKAPRISATKSSRKGKARVDEDANITPDKFRNLAVAPSFTQAVASIDEKVQKHTFRTGQYARFLGTPLMSLTRPIKPWEWWIGKIIEIRRSNTDAGFWLCVQWLWSRDEIKAVGIRLGDASCMGRWERSSCESVKSQDFVHSATIDGPAHVYELNENTQLLPNVGVFFIRSMYHFSRRSLEFTEKELQCRCVECGLAYNPDIMMDKPLRLCAHCKVWCHSNCTETGRLVQSTHFADAQHHAKGLLLSGLGEPIDPGPRSKKARIVSLRAERLDLANIADTLPKGIANTLIDIAQTRIVRPLPGNIAGNIAYVLRAREWIREARASGGLDQSRRAMLKKWHEKLIETIDVEDVLAPDTREEARLSALYVCKNCGYPV